MILPQNRIFFAFITLILIISLISPVFGAGLWASPPEFKFNLNSPQTVTGELRVWNIENEYIDVVVEKKMLIMDGINLLYYDKEIARDYSLE